LPFEPATGATPPLPELLFLASGCTEFDPERVIEEIFKFSCGSDLDFLGLSLLAPLCPIFSPFKKNKNTSFSVAGFF
jgi:hypothetical protein